MVNGALLGSTADERTHKEHIAARRMLLRAQLKLLATAMAHRNSHALELCCGHGHFLASYASAHSAESCVGVDFCRDRVNRAGRKAARVAAGNIQFVRASAEDFLEVWPERPLFNRIFILFPDPWPKRRHRKNRLLNFELLSSLARVSSPGAELFFRTDSEDYFRETSALLETHPAWRLQPAHDWPFEHATVFQLKCPAYHSLAAVKTDAAR